MTLAAVALVSDVSASCHAKLSIFEDKIEPREERGGFKGKVGDTAQAYKHSDRCSERWCASEYAR